MLSALTSMLSCIMKKTACRRREVLCQGLFFASGIGVYFLEQEPTVDSTQRLLRATTHG
jgi:hypothetical protein